MTKLTLQPLNPLVFSVIMASGEHVGYLKKIGAVWKFKAIGHEADGSLVPGGGPLTHRHNMVFAVADEARVSRELMG